MRMIMPLMIFACATQMGCEQRREVCITTDNGETSKHMSMNMTQEPSVELEKRIESMCGHVKTQPITAKREASELRSWICSLETDEIRALAIEKMENRILSIDTRRLPKADRERAINVIFDLEMEVVNGLSLMKSSHARRWETRIKALNRLKKEIDNAKLESKRPGLSVDEKRHLEYFVQFVDANYQSDQKMFEYDLVINGVNEIESKEYDEIRKKFEEFLGRPLKTKDDFK